MTQPPNRNQPSDRGGRSRPVPLEQRLEGVRLGRTSPAVVQALLVRLALSPIMAFPGPDVHAAEELVRLANEQTLARTDPAVRHGWGFDRACLASVAWLVEQAFVLREQHSRDSKTWRRLSEVTRRTTKDLALVVRPGVMGLVGHACAGRFKSAGVLESWAARNEAAAAIAGTRPDADAELSLQALCCLPLDRVYAACRDLVASGPASPEAAAVDLARASAQEISAGICAERVLPYLDAAIDNAFDTPFDDALRPVLVTPFAALWASGALRAEAERRKPSSAVRSPELERRLAAAR